MRVLIIKLSSIGDVIHTLPSLYALRKGYEKRGQKIEVDWLVEEAASSILKGHPLIDEVIVVKRGWGKNLRENLRTAGYLASKGYDIVIDFQGLLKSGAWVMLSKGGRRMGFSNAREFSHLFLNEKLAPYDPDMHAVDRYLVLAKAAGGDTTKVFFPMDLEAASAPVRVMLKEKGVEGPFFVLVTRARWATKLWSDERFAALARKITASTGLKAVLAGAPADRPGLEAVKERIGSAAVNLAGKTGLKELAALFNMSRFAVTVDSGPMHLAAAAGAKVVALFGPTAPWRTGPYGEGHIIVRKELECSPCFKKACPDARCMEGITVDEVYAAVEKVLKGTKQE